MLKNLSLSLKLTLLPAIALLGLLLFVVYTALQLSHNDQRLLALESTSYPTLERADAAIFHSRAFLHCSTVPWPRAN